MSVNKQKPLGPDQTLKAPLQRSHSESYRCRHQSKLSGLVRSTNLETKMPERQSGRVTVAQCAFIA